MRYTLDWSLIQVKHSFNTRKRGREETIEDRQGADRPRIEGLPLGVRVAARLRGRFVLVHRSRPWMTSRGGRGRDDCRRHVGGDVRDVKAGEISQNRYVNA